MWKVFLKIIYLEHMRFFYLRIALRKTARNNFAIRFTSFIRLIHFFNTSFWFMLWRINLWNVIVNTYIINGSFSLFTSWIRISSSIFFRRKQLNDHRRNFVLKMMKSWIFNMNIQRQLANWTYLLDEIKFIMNSVISIEIAKGWRW